MNGKNGTYEEADIGGHEVHLVFDLLNLKLFAQKGLKDA